MSEAERTILKELTLEEKCALCGLSGGAFGAIPRLGLAGAAPAESPRGTSKEYQPVVFPTESALAMSWDEEAAYRAGECLALECRANPEPVRWLLRPGVNVKRSPLCGRGSEYFSEDPVLSGLLAGAMIRGLQENDVAAGVKRYLCADQESGGGDLNVLVSDRALREIYLLSFELALRTGAPLSVLTASHRVNGRRAGAGENGRLLREELGYGGLTLSDGGDGAAADVFRVPAADCGPALCAAVREGRIPEADLDDALERLLTLTGAVSVPAPAAADPEALHAAARDLAARCTVLLQNNGALPLKKDPDQKLLLLGAMAADPVYMAGGAREGYRAETYLDAMRAVAPGAAYAPALTGAALEQARTADAVLVFAGPEHGAEGPGRDRESTRLPEGQRAMLDELARAGVKPVLVLSGGGALDVMPWADKLAAVVYHGLGGEAAAAAAVDVLFGDAEPGGRLAETWPVSEEYGPAYLNFPRPGKDMGEVMYGEGIYVGYRWYERRGLPVLYPFGHGLSYTKFTLGRPRLSTRELAAGDTLTVTVPVTNTGGRPGSQVVQLYLSHEGGSIGDHPVKELKAFKKVYLNPGETAEAVLTLGPEAFRFYAPSLGHWVTEDGGYLLSVGTSVADIVHRELVVLSGGDRADSR